MASDHRRQLDCAEAACDWFWEQDSDGRLIYLSDAFDSRANLSPEGTIGRMLADAFQPVDGADPSLATLLGTREDFQDLTLAYRDRSDRTRWVRLSGRAILDGDGRFTGYRGSAKCVAAGESTDAAYRRLFESSATPILIYEQDTLEILAVNDAGLRQYGYARAAFLKLTLADLHPRDAMPFPFSDDEADPTRLHGERHLSATGAVLRVDAEVHALTYAGRPAMALLARDVTDEREATDALRRSEARYRTLYEQSPTMLFTVDERGRIRTVNRGGASRLGHRRGDLVGRPVSDLYPEQERAKVSGHMASCLQQPGTVRSWEAWKLTHGGKRIRVRETARSVRTHDGRISALCFSEDITESHTRSTELAFQASHDGLTGLLNRREFLHRLERLLPRAGALEGHHALCYLDLDRFKLINDTSGHAAGDAFLRQLGELLRSRVRSRDSVARLGGDEFGILMEHCDLDAAERVAGGLLEAVTEFQFCWDDKCYSVGASVGVAALIPGKSDAAEALCAADRACYAAKHQGGNRIQLVIQPPATDPTGDKVADSAWATRISRALEEQRFCLYAQAIQPTDAKPGAGTGGTFELLLRLRESGDLVTPGSFLPAVERNQLGTSLDRWVLNTALDYLTSRSDEAELPAMLSLNLSNQSVLEAEFGEFVSHQIQAHDIPGCRLCFEIPDAVVLTDVSAVTRFMGSLENHGCHFALDGFGGSMASFQHLKQLPVDFVKIDGRCVRDIPDDPVDLAMVQSINQIAHALGKKTIAEFVENTAILDELKRIGVDYVQGYEIGEPRPLEPDTAPA